MRKNPFKIILMFLLSNLLKIESKKNLSILIYHRVLPEKDYMRPNTPTQKEFDRQMEIIAKYFTPISLSDALKRMKEGGLPKNSVCVTFDDGYSDNETIALPILKKWNIPATIFISTGLINGGIMWNDIVIESIKLQENKTLDLRRYELGVYDISTENKKNLTAESILKKIKHYDKNLRTELVEYIRSMNSEILSSNMMLTSRQIINLVDSGVEIGGHTVTHPILSKLSKIDAYDEILNGKEVIESITRKTCRYFAYPNGRPKVDYLPEHVDMLKNIGFEAGLSTTWGVSNNDSDRFEMARFTPWDKNPTKFMIRLLLNSKNII